MRRPAVQACGSQARRQGDREPGGAVEPGTDQAPFRRVGGGAVAPFRRVGGAIVGGQAPTRSQAPSRPLQTDSDREEVRSAQACAVGTARTPPHPPQPPPLPRCGTGCRRSGTPARAPSPCPAPRGRRRAAGPAGLSLSLSLSLSVCLCLCLPPFLAPFLAPRQDCKEAELRAEREKREENSQRRIILRRKKKE